MISMDFLHYKHWQISTDETLLWAFMIVNVGKKGESAKPRNLNASTEEIYVTPAHI